MWRQGLYAFLLRRILGPYLSAASNSKLHDCIEVSLTEGSFLLKDVDLDPKRITEILLLESKQGIVIRRIFVRKLTIALSMQESSSENSSGDLSSSRSSKNLVRNALVFGTYGGSATAPGLSSLSSSSGGMALLAEIEIDGVEVEVAPGREEMYAKPPKDSSFNDDATEPKTESGGIIASYVEAALNSLRLSLSIRNLLIKIFSNPSVHNSGDTMTERWVAIRLGSAQYHDLVEDNPVNRLGKPAVENVLHKTVEFANLTVEVGTCSRHISKPESEPLFNQHQIHNPSNETNESMLIAQAQGTGHVHFRVTKSSVLQNPPSVHLQRDLQISLNQCFAIDLDETSIHTLLDVISSITITDTIQTNDGNETRLDEVNSVDSPLIDGVPLEINKTDDDDLSTLASVMEQYAEARHFARTRELRGGMLVPDVSVQDDKTGLDARPSVTFDTFFDANDQSFHHYRSVLSESKVQQIGKETGQTDEFVHTKVMFHLLECRFRVHFDTPNTTHKTELWDGLTMTAAAAGHDSQESFVSASSSTMEGSRLEDSLILQSSTSDQSSANAREYLLLYLGDCNMSASLSEAEANVDLNLSTFDIEESVRPKNPSQRPVIQSLIQFPEAGHENMALEDNSLIVSAAPCLSVKIQSEYDDASSSRHVSVTTTLRPLEITYRSATIDNLKGMMQSLETDDAHAHKKSAQSAPPSKEDDTLNLSVLVSCPTMTLIYPLEIESSIVGMDQARMAKCESLLGGRGFRTNALYSESAFGLVMDDLEFEITNKTTERSSRDEATSTDQTKSFQCSLTNENGVLFVCIPTLGGTQSRRGRDMMVFDLATWSSDHAVASSPRFKINFRKNPTNNGGTLDNGTIIEEGAFPLVSPLSSVKARQEDGRNGERSRPEQKKRNIRAKDPQIAMLSDANECKSILEVSIPIVYIDLTTTERDAIVLLLDAQKNDKNTRQLESAPTSSASNDQKAVVPDEYFAIAISCGEISLSLHGQTDPPPKNGEKSEYSTHSHLFILEGVRSHLLTNSNGLRNLRFLVQDLAFYEVENLLIPRHQTNRRPVRMTALSVSSRSAQVHERTPKHGGSRASLILFRSKLGVPLSPETPAIMFDFLRRSDGDGVFDDEERSIHLSIYDVTHRYDMGSKWLDNLIRHAKVNSSGNGDTKETSEETKNVRSSMTNLFVTLSDCGIDYTSPVNFGRASRSILRISEIRVSSNIVDPPGPVQALKLSVSDMTFYLCNWRVPHNQENVHILHSKQLFHQSEIYNENIVSNSQGPRMIEETLRKMDFIPVLALDSMDTLVEIAKQGKNGALPWGTSNVPRMPKANLTATLDVGQLSVLVCRDSFQCLLDTLGEAALKLTTPSKEAFLAMKAEASAGVPNIEASLRQIEIPSQEPLFGEQKNGESHVPEISVITGLEGTSNRDNVSVTENTIFHFNGGPEHAKPPARLFEETLSPQGETDTTLKDVPDSELSASELRRKHGMIQSDDNNASRLAKSLLIKNYYTLNTSIAPPSRSTFDDGSGDKTSFLPDNSQQQENRESLSTEAGLLLGGHGWTTVDRSRFSKLPSGVEQTATWYSSSQSSGGETDQRNAEHQHQRALQIFPQYIPIGTISDPLFEGDMNAAQFADMEQPPTVKLRIICRDFSLLCKLFDGYDWPLQTRPSASHRSAEHSNPDRAEKTDRRAKLLEELVGDVQSDTSSPTFQNFPLPEERAARIERVNTERRLSRQTKRFFQVSVARMRMRIDSFEQSPVHRLSSCLDLSVSDLFIVETVSCKKPIKLMGEWLNEKDHPRYSNDGLVMLKIFSMRPTTKVTADGKLMGDESHVSLELLPLRCFVDQRATDFIREFVAFDDGQKKETIDEGIEIVGMFFQKFCVKPAKLKVDYRPEKIDTDALRDGSLVQLANLLPLEDMVVFLQPVEIQNVVGWGDALGGLIGQWISDICATQMHKFITKSRPFHPITNVGGGIADLVMIPLDEIRQDGGSLKTGIQKGTSAFAGAIAYEVLNTGSKVTRYAATQLSGSGDSSGQSRNGRRKKYGSSLPPRPSEVPHDMSDVASHAYESVSGGLKEAGYKIVIVPYREYQRNGTSGAVRSVVRGIPVAVGAPIGGVTEALSYALLSVRNQLRPEIRKEEEETRRGLSAES